jgi:hypothetical protein
MEFNVLDWGSVADWVVAVTAVVGVCFGLLQLRALGAAERLSVQLARATLLREFDQDFESPEMQESRLRIGVVRNRFEAEVASRKPQLSDEKQIAEVALQFSNHVTTIWEQTRTFDGDINAAKDKSADEYALLMRLPYWFETVGHLCKRNLVPLEDMLDLYDQVVIVVIGNILQHIQIRADRPPHKNRRFLENSVWLFERAKAHRKKRDTPPLSVPVVSETVWGT